MNIGNKWLLAVVVSLLLFHRSKICTTVPQSLFALQLKVSGNLSNESHFWCPIFYLFLWGVSCIHIMLRGPMGPRPKCDWVADPDKIGSLSQMRLGSRLTSDWVPDPDEIGSQTLMRLGPCPRWDWVLDLDAIGSPTKMQMASGSDTIRSRAQMPFGPGRIHVMLHSLMGTWDGPYITHSHFFHLSQVSHIDQSHGMVSQDVILEICVLGRVMIRAWILEICVLRRFMFRTWGISLLEYWILEGAITTWSKIVFFYHICLILFYLSKCLIVLLCHFIIRHH